MVPGKSHLSLQAPANGAGSAAEAGEAGDRAHIDCRGSKGRYERWPDSSGKLGPMKEFRTICEPIGIFGKRK